MCLEIKIFLLPIQINFSFSRVFSNCCKVCSEDVTRAENSFAGLLYMNLRSVADCMIGESLNFSVFVLLIFHLRVNIMGITWNFITCRRDPFRKIRLSVGMFQKEIASIFLSQSK